MGTNVLEVSLKSTAHVHVCHLECHACTLQYLFTRTCTVYVVNANVE